MPVSGSGGSVYFNDESGQPFGLQQLNNQIIVLAASYYLEVIAGNIAGRSIIHKFGRNSAVPNGSWEGILETTAQFNWLTAATTVRIKAGGNAADTAAGAGAREITVEGIDNSGALASEAIVTAGALASSATTTSFWRVFRAHVSAVGTYGVANTGAIVIENSAGGTDLLGILAGQGQSEYGAYSIPAGKTGYLLSVSLSVDAGKAADVRLFTRENFNDVAAPMSPKRLRMYWDAVLGQEEIKPKSPILSLPAYTDIWFEGDGGGAQTEVEVDFEILLVDN